MDGQVRITVLATGFDPYAGNEPKAVEAAKPVETPIPTRAVVETGIPMNSRVDNPRKFVMPSFGAADRPASRSTETETTSEVFDESEIDIPAFLREHRNKPQA